MDVGVGGSQGEPPRTTLPGDGGQLGRAEVERILGERQGLELQLARGFRECWGLSDQQLEDLYQDLVFVLLERSYNDEQHLCGELRIAIKRRALNMHRDEGRRAEIFAENAPAIHALQAARAADEGPEQLLLARQDWLVIAEFMAELTPDEQRVFGLVSEGMKYNRIAKRRGIQVNEARNLVASCERKRKRFQVLYERGRLCGYRAETIKQLLDGQATSEQLVQQAAAHLQACARCRAEYKTNAQQLKRAFQEQAVALLQPTLTSRLGRQTRLAIHARMLAQRIHPDLASIGQGGVRERATALIAGGGASAKLAAGIATVAVIAGGTLTATRALEPKQPHTHHRTAPAITNAAPATRLLGSVRPSVPAPARAVIARTPRSAPARHRHTSGHIIARDVASASSANRREPGGFAYLGVPTHTATAPAQPVAQTATHAGGPFSP